MPTDFVTLERLVFDNRNLKKPVLRDWIPDLIMRIGELRQDSRKHIFVTTRNRINLVFIRFLMTMALQQEQ